MGQHVLSKLQKLKIMNLSCTTSSADVCVCVWCWWVAGAGCDVRSTTGSQPGQARPLGRDDMVRDSCRSVSSAKIELKDCILLIEHI